MKKIVSVIVIAVGMFALVGCGQSNKNLTVNDFPISQVTNGLSENELKKSVGSPAEKADAMTSVLMSVDVVQADFQKSMNNIGDGKYWIYRLDESQYGKNKAMVAHVVDGEVLEMTKSPVDYE